MGFPKIRSLANYRARVGTDSASRSESIRRYNDTSYCLVPCPCDVDATMTFLQPDLDIETLRRIEAKCSEFEMQRDGPADFDRFLEGTSGQERLILIQELVALDADIRRVNGEQPLKEDYAKYAEELKLTPAELLLEQGIPRSFLKHGLVDEPLGRVMPRSERYRFEHRLGRGGIGDVWRVLDRHTQRTLAIKTLQAPLRQNADAVERLRREAILTGSLQHPGIPPVYDHGSLDDETPFFSMKLVAGKTFRDILKENPPRKSMELVQIFLNVTQTIAYAHECGVIHRDLKPSNIMVGRFGEVQVMDWGLAKKVQQDDESTLPPESVRTNADVASLLGEQASVDAHPDESHPTPSHPDLTTDGDIIGTPRFMSPEQARGEVDSLTPRSDVFGLGSILFQVLTGKTIFANVPPSGVIEKLRGGDLNEVHEQLDRLTGNSEHSELAKWCRRCLHPDPDHRPSSANEIAQAVGNYLSDLKEKVHRAEVDRAAADAKRHSETRRQRWVVGMSAAITIVSLAGLAATAYQWKQASLARDSTEKARERAESEAIATGEINVFLNEILSSALPENQGYDVTLREVIDEATPMLDGRFADKPRVEASIRHTLGKSYRWLGEFNRSERLLRAALAAYERAGEVDEEEVLKAKDALAGTLRTRDESREDLLESERLRREIVERRRELNGPNSEETARALNNLGVVLLDQEEWDEAGEIFAEAIKILNSISEPTMDRNAIDLNLAEVFRNRDGLRVAEPMYLEILNRDDVHPIDRANGLTQLGEQVYLEHQYDRAIEYLRDALEIRRKQFGPDNPLTLSSMRKLARAYEAAQQFDSLSELVATSLPAHIDRYGASSSRTFETHLIQSNAMVGLGRQDKAIEYLEQLVETISQDRGEDHPLVEQAKSELHQFRERLGK